jgi:hypothetical protein
VTERIARIKKALESKEKCHALHVTSLLVNEQLEGKVIWEGIVETFDLHDHPTAKVAYAWERWRDEEKAEPEYTIVLGVPPINSAQDAVKAAIVAFRK